MRRLSCPETDASSASAASYPRLLAGRMHHLSGCTISIGPRLRDRNRKISQIGAADFPKGFARICGEGLIRGRVQEGDHPISFSARIRMGVVLKRKCLMRRESARTAHPCHIVFFLSHFPLAFIFIFYLFVPSSPGARSGLASRICSKSLNQVHICLWFLHALQLGRH